MKDFVSDLKAFTDEDMQDVLNNSMLGLINSGHGTPQGSTNKSNSIMGTTIGTTLSPPGTFINPLPPTWNATYVTSPPSAYNLYPFQNLNLSDDDVKLIEDFKKRQPDFDSLEPEIQLILQHQPGLANTPLFISIIYETARKLHKTCEECIDSEGASEIIDGAPKED